MCPFNELSLKGGPLVVGLFKPSACVCVLCTEHEVVI